MARRYLHANVIKVSCAARLRRVYPGGKVETVFRGALSCHPALEDAERSALLLPALPLLGSGSSSPEAISTKVSREIAQPMARGAETRMLLHSLAT